MEPIHIKSVDPITAAAYILVELRRWFPDLWLPWKQRGADHGKDRRRNSSQLIPDTVTMEGTVRTVSRETRALMEEKIRQIACHGAEALGASCEVEYKREFRR